MFAIENEQIALLYFEKNRIIEQMKAELIEKDRIIEYLKQNKKSSLYLMFFILFLISNCVCQGIFSAVFTSANVTLSADNFNPYGTIFRQNFNTSVGPLYDTLPLSSSLVTAYGQLSYHSIYKNLRLQSMFILPNTGSTLSTYQQPLITSFQIPGESSALFQVSINTRTNTTQFYVLAIE